MRHLGRLPTLAIAALLAGCGNLLASHRAAPLVYELRAPPPVPAATHLEAALVIARPLARPGLDSDRIAVRLADHRVESYAGSRWSAPLPDLVAALLLEALRDSAGWQAVTPERAEFPGRYRLQPEIREFTADYSAGPGAPTVRVVLGAELGTVSGPRYTASVAAQAAVAAAADRQRDVIAAFQAACDQALKQLVTELQVAAAGH